MVSHPTTSIELQMMAYRDVARDAAGQQRVQAGLSGSVDRTRCLKVWQKCGEGVRDVGGNVVGPVDGCFAFAG